LTRPPHLPDFKSPPINEVVVGVQFEQPEGYQQIRAGDVWSLYRADFPVVEEKPALPLVFETFGLPQASQFDFGLVTGASHDRFWFLAPGKEELIQFQNDRLLHNWRKVGDQTNEYPRFEKIIEKFESELRTLESYMGSLAGRPNQRLKINQSEITYINQILCEGATDASRWLSLLNIDAYGFEDFNCTFRRRVHRPDGSPYARLTCQTALGVRPKGERIIVLNLTFRGAPEGDSLEAAIAFLGTGRQMIVEFFTQITTEQAHLAWGRSQ
jgi:uncharacterized protein (TIGR04255 family)